MFNSKFKYFIAALAWLVFSSQAFSAVSFTSKGTNNNTSGATIAVTSITAASGGVIVVVVTEAGTCTAVGTVSDGGTNTYTSPANGTLNNSSTNGCGGVFIAVNNSSISAATITYTKNTSGHAAAISVTYISGFFSTPALDTAVTATHFGHLTSASVLSGLPVEIGEALIALGSTDITSGCTTGTGNGWATPPNAVASAGNAASCGGSQLQAGAAAKAFYTLNASGVSNIFQGIIGFTGASAQPVASGLTRSLMGVGQ